MNTVITAYDRLADAPERARAGAWALVCEADQAFWPALSTRAPEQGLSVGLGAAPTSEPTAYWRSIQGHGLLTAEDETGVVTGMMSVARDKPLPQLGLTATAYLSTLIVAQAARGRGLARQLYAALFELADGWSGSPIVATRTWSTNDAHLPLIAALGFEEALRLADDRGPGIDTVYFLKRL